MEFEKDPPNILSLLTKFREEHLDCGVPIKKVHIPKNQIDEDYKLLLWEITYPNIKKSDFTIILAPDNVETNLSLNKIQENINAHRRINYHRQHMPMLNSECFISNTIEYKKDENDMVYYLLEICKIILIDDEDHSDWINTITNNPDLKKKIKNHKCKCGKNLGVCTICNYGWINLYTKLIPYLRKIEIISKPKPLLTTSQRNNQKSSSSSSRDNNQKSRTSSSYNNNQKSSTSSSYNNNQKLPIGSSSSLGSNNLKEYEGIIFSIHKNWGFIKCDELLENPYFYFNDIQNCNGKININKKVRFNIVKTENGDKAININEVEWIFINETDYWNKSWKYQ